MKLEYIAPFIHEYIKGKRKTEIASFSSPFSFFTSFWENHFFLFFYFGVRLFLFIFLMIFTICSATCPSFVTRVEICYTAAMGRMRAIRSMHLYRKCWLVDGCFNSPCLFNHSLWISFAFSLFILDFYSAERSLFFFFFFLFAAISANPTWGRCFLLWNWGTFIKKKNTGKIKLFFSFYNGIFSSKLILC